MVASIYGKHSKNMYFNLNLPGTKFLNLHFSHYHHLKAFFKFFTCQDTRLSEVHVSNFFLHSLAVQQLIDLRTIYFYHLGPFKSIPSDQLFSWNHWIM